MDSRFIGFYFNKNFKKMLPQKLAQLKLIIVKFTNFEGEKKITNFIFTNFLKIK